jgi:hypothetical protein
MAPLRANCLECGKTPKDMSRFCSLTCYELWYEKGGRIAAQVELELRAANLRKSGTIQAMREWHRYVPADTRCKCGDEWPCIVATFIEYIGD